MFRWNKNFMFIVLRWMIHNMNKYYQSIIALYLKTLKTPPWVILLWNNITIFFYYIWIYIKICSSFWINIFFQVYYSCTFLSSGTIRSITTLPTISQFYSIIKSFVIVHMIMAYIYTFDKTKSFKYLKYTIIFSRTTNTFTFFSCCMIFIPHIHKFLQRNMEKSKSRYPFLIFFY